MPGKIPATVVTGFLGAGKTSLIRNLLRDPGGRRIAVIVNEFGEVGVDGGLLEDCGDPDCAGDVVELANGCICCTVADEFLPTMEALLARAPAPDHIVVETSGLALPKPLVRAFSWPEVRTRVTVDGVVTVLDSRAAADGRFAADAAAVEAQRAADEALDHDSPLAELFEDQLACADMVVLNKTDLVGADELAALEARIGGRVRPGVKCVRGAHGAAPPAALLGLAAAAEDDLAARPSHHDGAGDHDHDDFSAFCLDLPDPPAPEPVIARLRALARDHDILRVKGVLAVAGRDMRLVVQGVGDRFQHYYDRDWRPGEERASRLVFIGARGLDRAAIAAEL